jgi:hypothetical protein
MTKRVISRMEGIRNQLDSAVRVYFLWDDLVSAITLAGAAERVLSDMQPQDGIMGADAYSIRSIINLYIKPEHQKDAAKLFRKDYDFFRHADRDSVTHYELHENAADFLLMTTIRSFQFLGQKSTPAMRAFIWWFMAKYPHLVKKDAPHRQLASKMRENAKNLSKKEYFAAFMSAVAPKPLSIAFPDE